VSQLPDPLPPDGILLDESLGTYDDSWQTAGDTCTCDVGFGEFDCPCLVCRSLRHEMHLVATGPNEDSTRSAVNQCYNEAIQAGAIAGVIAAWSGGGALGAAVDAATKYMVACLANKGRDSVAVRFDDKSHWTDWGQCGG
jgi:hypothetical protein